MKNQYKENIVMVLFAASTVFSFRLINFDEMIRAFIGIAIINGWFFTILILNITGKIRFADEEVSEETHDMETGGATDHDIREK